MQLRHIEEYISSTVYGFSTLVTLFVPLVKDVHEAQKQHKSRYNFKEQVIGL